jgi:SAM-dependent methyltransferase
MWSRDEYIPTLHEIAWLASAEGRAACAEMAAGHPADTPTAIARWRERLDAEWVTVAWKQVLLRQTGRVKFSRADQMIFDRIGLEQSSDEVVATHKARRFAGSGRIADLCCGIGGDTLALAAHAPVIAVDISGPRSAMAEHNAGVYGRRAEGIIGDVELTHPEADAAHIDPDRRPVGRREHELEHGSPDLRVVENLVRRYAHLAIKLSPGAGFERLPFPAEIELISHHGHCKQAVAWTGRFVTAHRRATVLPAGDSIAAGDQRELIWPPARAIEPGLCLLEPDAAVIRANLVGVLARQLDAAPVDSHIAWLLREQAVSTPFANAFRVIDTLGFNEKKVRPWLAGHGVGSLDIKTRGVAFQPEDIARHLKLRGDRRAVLLIARIADKPLAILAERM